MPSLVKGPTIWWMAKPERPVDAMHNAGARLRVTRAILGFQQQEMARVLGVEPQTWNNWERGRNLVDPLAMARGALRYGFTLDWIYLGSLVRMPGDLTAEIEQRRPDLVLGAAPDAAAAPGWDQIKRPAVA